MRYALLSDHIVYSAAVPSFTEDVNLPGTPSQDDVPIAGDGELIYIEQIHTMREYELTTLYVDFGHLLQKDDVLADAIQRQYYRFLPYLRKALHNLVAEYEPEYLKINPTSAAMDSTNLQSREFSVAFYHLPLVSAIRDLKTDKIGTLMSISGTVTRTSEVRPELLFGSFTCEVCKALVHDIEQQFKYTEVRPQLRFYSQFRPLDNHRSLLPSPIYAQTLLAAIVQRGNSKSILPSSPTGKKFVFKRILLRSRRVPCPGLWTSFFVPN